MIVLVGDLMMDVTARVAEPLHHASDTPAQVTMQPGGASANTASWLASEGADVLLAGAVGDDAMGHALLDELSARGIRTRIDVVAGLRTGVVVVIVEPGGERTMLPDKGANVAFDASGLDELFAAAVADSGASGGLHLHLSGYSLLNPATRVAATQCLDLARKHGATTSVDAASAAPLLAERAAFIAAVGEVADGAGVGVLLANADEARALTGIADASEAARAMLTWCECAVVKRGSQGVVAVAGATSGEVVSVPAAQASVVDTTGAGDAFTAGFLPVWAAGRPLADALGAGTRVAASAISRVGAGPPAA